MKIGNAREMGFWVMMCTVATRPQKLQIQASWPRSVTVCDDLGRSLHLSDYIVLGLEKEYNTMAGLKGVQNDTHCSLPPAAEAMSTFPVS